MVAGCGQSTAKSPKSKAGNDDMRPSTACCGSPPSSKTTDDDDDDRPTTAADRISIVTGCRNRAAELVKSLPAWITALSTTKTKNEIIIVDWSSTVPLSTDPDLAAIIIKQNRINIRIARIDGADDWSLPQALNFGFSLACHPLVLKIDTDVTISDNFLQRHPLSASDTFFYAGNWRKARNQNETHLNGLFFAPIQRIRTAGGFNEHLSGYGFDDSDLYRRLIASGTGRRHIHPDYAAHADHAHDSASKELIMRNMFLSDAMPWSAQSWPRRFRPVGTAIDDDADNNRLRRWSDTGRWTAAPDTNKPTTAVLEACLDNARRAVLADDRGIGWNATAGKSSAFLADLLSRRGPKIVIEPKNGLGNRLRALASAAVFAEQRKRPLLVLWIPDDQCEAAFDRLFERRNLLVFSSVKDLESSTDVRWSDCARYTPGLPLVLPTTADNPTTSIDNEKSEFTAAIQQHSGPHPHPHPHPHPKPGVKWYDFDGPLWITSACSLDYPNASWTTESAWLRRHLIFTKTVQSRIDSLSTDLSIRDCIGVHIRIGQGSSVHFEDASGWNEKQTRRLHHFRHGSYLSFFVHELLATKHLRGRPIFLCTDRPESIDEFRSLLPEDDRWRLRFVPPPTGTTYRTCDRSAIQVEGAIVEAVLLSRCFAFFGSPWSTFTELAVRYGAVNSRIAGQQFAHRRFAAFYHPRSINLGDTIQTLAVMQFIPERPELDDTTGVPTGRIKPAGTPDGYVDRDAPSTGLFDDNGRFRLAWSAARGPYMIVHSGWFDGRLVESNRFPDQLSPLVLSMHINESPLLSTDPKYTDLLAKHGRPDQTMLKQRLTWFRDHAPIGCRDRHTADLLTAAGIRSFVSGCATLLLKRPANVTVGNDVLVIDSHILYPKLLAAAGVPATAERMSMVLPPNMTVAQKTDFAKYMLRRMAAAKCVVTSRLHAALPALSMDVPVLFLFDPDDVDTDVRFDDRMKTILNIDTDRSAWNWTAPAITDRQKTAIADVRSSLGWRLEHFYSIQ